MAFKVFIDANIILDFTLGRSNAEDAGSVIKLVTSRAIRGYVTPSIVQMCGHWLTKAYGAKKAKEILLTLLIDIQTIDIFHEMALAALNSKINDIEDAIQYYTAIHHKMDYFVSEDKTLKKESLPQVPVLTAKEFLQEFLP